MRKRVLVVGAGPAGLRVAGVAARRGHDVLLLERSDEPGGHLRMLSRLPTRADWGLAVDDLAGGAERAGAVLRFGVAATPELLAAEGAQVVVCATGSTWDRDGASPARPDRAGIPGTDGARVLDVATAAERALADPHALGRRVVIVDESGTYLPLGLAEVLAQAGVEVEVVTRHLVVGQDLIENLDAGHVFPRLEHLGVTLTAQHFVERIDEAVVELASIWGTRTRRLDGVDYVVIAMQRTPNDALFRSLAARLEGVHVIGDALAPRRAGDAIYEGEQLGRAL